MIGACTILVIHFLFYWPFQSIFRAVCILDVDRVTKRSVAIYGLSDEMFCFRYGPLTRYVKLLFAHAPGMPGTFSPIADFEGNRLLVISACITARAWRTCRDACRDRLPAVMGKMFPAFPAHAHPQLCVSGKKPIDVGHAAWQVDVGHCVQYQWVWFV